VRGLSSCGGRKLQFARRGRLDNSLSFLLRRNGRVLLIVRSCARGLSSQITSQALRLSISYRFLDETSIARSSFRCNRFELNPERILFNFY
jgi:hypothetical protein